MTQQDYGMGDETRRGLDAIARKHGFRSIKRLQEPGKFKAFCAARKDCYRYLHAERGWSTPQIAKLFNRDHTTVVYALDNRGTAAAKNARSMKRYWEKRAVGRLP